MGAYLDEVRKLERRFDGIQMEHVHRGKNSIADEMSKVAAGPGPVPTGIFVERLYRPSVKPKPAPGDPSTSAQGAPGGHDDPDNAAATSSAPGVSTSRGDMSAKPEEEQTPQHM